MRVPFDNGTPRTLARFLIDRHTVTEARSQGWAELENGELLSKAEAAGFELLVTTDKNISYQQNLSGRKIAIAVPGKGRWTLIEPHIAATSRWTSLSSDHLPIGLRTTVPSGRNLGSLACECGRRK